MTCEHQSKRLPQARKSKRLLGAGESREGMSIAHSKGGNPVFLHSLDSRSRVYPPTYPE